MAAGNTDAVLALYRQMHPGMGLAEPVIAPRNRTLEQAIASHAGRPQIVAQEAPARISYRMLSPLFRRKTQLQLEAHAAQDVAGAVADRDRVVHAVVE